MNSYTHLFFIIFTSCLILACQPTSKDTPSFVPGTYTDDYGIEYTISSDLFEMKPNTKFNIIEWNMKGQYIIAKNDSSNKFDAGLYTRIDWMKFENQAPYTWGFCYSTYNAPTADSAKNVNVVDRVNPKIGCNGFPFSRMKLKH